LPRFLLEANLRHDFEELIEQPVAEIDHRGAPVIGKNAVKQRHLTARIGDVERPDQTRKTASEGGLAGVKIITDQRTSTDPQEFDQ
jgi:hypothetical protein